MFSVMYGNSVFSCVLAIGNDSFVVPKCVKQSYRLAWIDQVLLQTENLFFMPYSLLSVTALSQRS